MSQHNRSWWERRGENIVNLTIGLAITLGTLWGIYIGLSLYS